MKTSPTADGGPSENALDGLLTRGTLEDADQLRAARRAPGGSWSSGRYRLGDRRLAAADEGVPVTLAPSADLPLEGALGRGIAEVYDGLVLQGRRSRRSHAVVELRLGIITEA